MSKLIDADELELDTEWSDYYDGFTSYSQSQINEAEEVKAIPLEKVKQAIEEIEQYLLEEECNGNHEKGIMFALEILEKNIGESKGEDAPDTNVGSKADGMTKEPTAYRRYRDLLEYFGNDSILEDDEEFKKWLERIKWHVRKANELYQKYECQKEHCEDAISRKKIEKLKRWRFSYDTNTTIPKSDLFVKLTDIRALPSVKSTQGWIPVSERLPKEETYVRQRE